MTHDDVIIFEKFKLKKNPKPNNCKKNFEIPLNPAEDMNITRFTCLRFARQVSPPYTVIIFNVKSTPQAKYQNFQMNLDNLYPYLGNFYLNPLYPSILNQFTTAYLEFNGL